MNVAIALALLGASLLIAPLERTTRPAGGHAAGRGGVSIPRPAVGPAVAVIGVGAANLAVFGWPAGLPAAVVAGSAVAITLRWLRGRPVPIRPDRALALALDLAAAALRSGRPLADALSLAAPAAQGAAADALERVAGLSRLGADATVAWSAAARDGPLSEIAVVAVRSATSGIKLAAAFERLAIRIRDDCAATAAARAHRAGVAAMGPLAACFLPSFVCLGVIPVVVGIAKSAFGGLT